MWYIFPQFEGLGLSESWRLLSIDSVAAARAFSARGPLGAVRRNDHPASQIFRAQHSRLAQQHDAEILRRPQTA